MNTRRDPDLLIKAFLEDGVNELPERSYDAVRAATDQTRQWVVIGPWREQQMSRFVMFAAAAAVIVIAAVVGLRFLPGDGGSGVGGQPPQTATPTAAPTASPSPIATLLPDSGRVLAAGTYAYHPLPAPNESLRVTFTVPEGWEAFGGALAPSGDGYAPPGGMAILFDDVTSLNAEPCDWSGTDDDVSVGPAVDELVEALRGQTAYEVSDPVDVTIGGYSGRRVDIVVPTEPFSGQTSDAPECDENNYVLWSTAAYGERPIHAQGPADRWRTNIVDVDGTRLVIVTRYFPGTSPADRAEMDAIVKSMVIAP